MSRHDEDIAADHADWSGFDDERDPPEEYLEAEAGRLYQYHLQLDHGGGECDCPPGEPEISEEPPF